MNNLCFSDLIKLRRQEKGMSQKELALLIGRDRSWVAHAESGNIVPAPEMAEKISSILGIPYMHQDSSAGGGACGTTLRRHVLKSFSSNVVPQRTSPPPGMMSFIDSLTSDWGMRSRLKSVNWLFREACILAFTLLQRGAESVRLSPAQLGMPLPLLNADGCSMNHVPCACLATESGHSSLVLFGAVESVWPGQVPPFLAVSGSHGSRFWLLDPHLDCGTESAAAHPENIQKNVAASKISAFASYGTKVLRNASLRLGSLRRCFGLGRLGVKGIDTEKASQLICLHQ